MRSLSTEDIEKGDFGWPVAAEARVPSAPGVLSSPSWLGDPRFQPRHGGPRLLFCSPGCAPFPALVLLPWPISHARALARVARFVTDARSTVRRRKRSRKPRGLANGHVREAKGLGLSGTCRQRPQRRHRWPDRLSRHRTYFSYSTLFVPPTPLRRWVRPRLSRSRSASSLLTVFSHRRGPRRP